MAIKFDVYESGLTKYDLSEYLRKKKESGSINLICQNQVYISQISC